MARYIARNLKPAFTDLHGWISFSLLLIASLMKEENQTESIIIGNRIRECVNVTRCIEFLSRDNQDHQTKTNRKGRNHNPQCFIWTMLTSRFDLVIFVIILVHIDQILTLHVSKDTRMLVFLDHPTDQRGSGTDLEQFSRYLDFFLKKQSTDIVAQTRTHTHPYKYRHVTLSL
jgi:hypothetical protein